MNNCQIFILFNITAIYKHLRYTVITGNISYITTAYDTREGNTNILAPHLSLLVRTQAPVPILSGNRESTVNRIESA